MNSSLPANEMSTIWEQNTCKYHMNIQDVGKNSMSLQGTKNNVGTGI